MLRTGCPRADLVRAGGTGWKAEDIGKALWVCGWRGPRAGSGR